MPESARTGARSKWPLTRTEATETRDKRGRSLSLVNRSNRATVRYFQRFPCRSCFLRTVARLQAGNSGRYAGRLSQNARCGARFCDRDAGRSFFRRRKAHHGVALSVRFNLGQWSRSRLELASADWFAGPQWGACGGRIALLVRVRMFCEHSATQDARRQEAARRIERVPPQPVAAREGLACLRSGWRVGPRRHDFSICYRRERRACCDSATPPSCAFLGWSILSHPGGPLRDQVTPAGVHKNKISQVLCPDRIKSALRRELTSRACALIARPLVQLSESEGLILA